MRPKNKDDWSITPNLWGGIIARPSMLKTPSLQEALRHLNRLEAEAKQEYEQKLRNYELDIEIFKMERDALKSSIVSAAKGKNGSKIDKEILTEQFRAMEEPKKPTRRRYKTNDATVEKLGELLNENPRGLLIFRDELIGLLVSWDRKDREADRSFFLEAWNGTIPYHTDRIGRGNVETATTCLSILGGIQPAKLTGYLHLASSDIGNDGLLQRFQLLVYPDEPKDWHLVDEYPDGEAKERAWRVFKNLSEMDFVAAGAKVREEEDVPYFRFDQDGQAVFNEWLTDLEAKLREPSEMPLMVEHLAKYRSLMPSLALVFHLIGVADGKSSGPVTKDAAEMAAAWCDYLDTHARRIYSILENMRQRYATELAKKIQEKALEDGFTAREVYRHHWHLLDTREAVDVALQELVDAGWVRPQWLVEPDKKPIETFQVNPKIFSQK